MLRRVALVRTEVSEELNSSIKVTRIGSPILITLMKEALSSSETAVTMKNGVFWDVTLCGTCKNRRFAGT
jgi:hypothetical protein